MPDPLGDSVMVVGDGGWRPSCLQRKKKHVNLINDFAGGETQRFSCGRHENCQFHSSLVSYTASLFCRGKTKHFLTPNSALCNSFDSSVLLKRIVLACIRWRKKEQKRANNGAPVLHRHCNFYSEFFLSSWNIELFHLKVLQGNCQFKSISQFDSIHCVSIFQKVTLISSSTYYPLIYDNITFFNKKEIIIRSLACNRKYKTLIKVFLGPKLIAKIYKPTKNRIKTLKRQPQESALFLLLFLSRKSTTASEYFSP